MCELSFLQFLFLSCEPLSSINKPIYIGFDQYVGIFFPVSTFTFVLPNKTLKPMACFEPKFIVRFLDHLKQVPIVLVTLVQVPFVLVLDHKTFIIQHLTKKFWTTILLHPKFSSPKTFCSKISLVPKIFGAKILTQNFGWNFLEENHLL